MAVDPKLFGLLEGFFAEAKEISNNVTREVLQLEQPQDPAALSKSYEITARGLHTLKGSAAILGLVELSQLAHQLEDRIAPTYKARAPLPTEAVDDLLGGLERFLAGVRAEIEANPKKIKTQESPAFQIEEKGSGEIELGSWRVDAHQMTGLLQEVEQLRELRRKLIEREQSLDALLSGLAESTPAKQPLRSLWRALRRDSQEATAVIRALEERVKALCTLPVKIILEPLVGAVRTLCQRTNKEAAISFVGAEVSLDRRLLEALRAPLVHLVNNAIDHGIEPPNVRSSLGKHKEGLLTIRVEQQGSTVFVEVSDDGAGIDLHKIRKVAHKYTKDTSDEALRQLIFAAGFSTRDEVSSSSGRGVGLSVVKEQVEALLGRIEVDSIWGQGTRFLMTLPAGLGSSLVLLVRCGEQSFGLPVQSIEEALLLRPQKLQHTQEATQLIQRDDPVPLRDLGVILGLRQLGRFSSGQPALLLQAQGQKLALAVDEIFGTQELVISPLPEELRGLSAYQGASTKTDGEPLLILRPEWIVQQRIEAPRQARRILVVDDSLTARAMHRAILEAGGFEVHAASSASLALEMLSRATYDALVCDLWMNEIDGATLTTMLRDREETRSLPIILVSKETNTERTKSLFTGAHRFLTKKECSQGRLLSEINAVFAEIKSQTH